jgi:hypothetical protein
MVRIQDDDFKMINDTISCGMEPRMVRYRIPVQGHIPDVQSLPTNKSKKVK